MKRKNSIFPLQPNTTTQMAKKSFPKATLQNAARKQHSRCVIRSKGVARWAQTAVPCWVADVAAALKAGALFFGAVKLICVHRTQRSYRDEYLTDCNILQ